MNPRASYLQHLECSECGRHFPSDYAAPKSCGDDGILFARYNLGAAKKNISRDQLREGPNSLWRYAPFLPAADQEGVVSFGEGWTPLLRAPNLGTEIGCPQVYIKDEGQNPSGSFKDRGASVAISRHRELGAKTVVLNSSGNASAAWSLYAARAGIRCVSIVPPDIQPASLAQCLLSGAHTYFFEDWHRSGKLVSEICAQNGWLNAGTLNEPYRMEGKKTMGYELAEQLDWKLPNAIFYPVGGGTGAIAIWKAFRELQDLGWIDGPVPRLFVTQYEGCAPIVKAFEDGADQCLPWGKIDILPGGLKSPKPPGGKQILALIRQTGGAALSVGTPETLQAASQVARTEGIFVCPEGGTTLAGLRKAVKRGLISPDERVVLMNTGSGLKSVPSLAVRTPKTITGAEDVAPLARSD